MIFKEHFGQSDQGVIVKNSDRPVQRLGPRRRVGNSLRSISERSGCNPVLRLLPTRRKTGILFLDSVGGAMMDHMKNSGSSMENPNRPARLLSVFATVLAVSVAVGSLGCTDKTPPPIKADIPLNSSPAAPPSTTVLGVEPAGPTRETAATTSKAKTDVSKEQQSTAMPLPGQANDHSVLLPAASPQRAASR